MSVSGKLTGTLRFGTCVKPALFGLLCAWREVLILRQHFHPIHYPNILTGGSDVRGKVDPNWVRKVLQIIRSL
jgi:hypothetical protein